MQLFGDLGQRGLCLFAALAFCGSSLIVPFAHAQSDSPDFEPPLIEHESVDSSSAADAQEFTATVVDDRKLNEVLLFYRFVGEEAFISIPMNQVASSSVFSATVETDKDDPRSIEYYIQAKDAAGNRVVKGFAFSPLVRMVDGSDNVAAISGGDRAAVVKVKPSNSKRLLYIGLGVLAVGAIAAAAGGSSGSDDDTAGGGDPGGDPSGPFNLTISPPQ